MKSISTIRTLMNAWCWDNKEHVKDSGMTFSKYMIRDCNATDWNWFMEESKQDNYTQEDVDEVKKFLSDYNYLPV